MVLAKDSLSSLYIITHSAPRKLASLIYSYCSQFIDEESKECRDSIIKITQLINDRTSIHTRQSGSGPIYHRNLSWRFNKYLVSSF